MILILKAIKGWIRCRWFSKTDPLTNVWYPPTWDIQYTVLPGCEEYRSVNERICNIPLSAPMYIVNLLSLE